MFKKKSTLNVRPEPPSFAEITEDINLADSNDIIFARNDTGMNWLFWFWKLELQLHLGLSISKRYPGLRIGELLLAVDFDWQLMGQLWQTSQTDLRRQRQQGDIASYRWHLDYWLDQSLFWLERAPCWNGNLRKLNRLMAISLLLKLTLTLV